MLLSIQSNTYREQLKYKLLHFTIPLSLDITNNVFKNSILMLIAIQFITVDYEH